MAGIVFLKKHINSQIFEDRESLITAFDILFYIIGFAALLLIFFYFRLSSLVRLLETMKWQKFVALVKVLRDVKLTILFNILSLSFARYVVFILQYYLLFSLFGVALTLGQTFAGVSIMFLIMAVVPSFTFLTDLGLRWSASIQVVQLFNTNTTGIFAVSLEIWLINLVIPALIGSLLILRVKLFKS
jgi:hypothetical protein